MKPTCRDCGSQDALTFVAEVGQNICSDCGTVSQELQLYEPSNIHDVAFALGIPWSEHGTQPRHERLYLPGRPFWSHSSEESRRINDLLRKPEVDARIQGILNALDHPGLFDQVDFLFQRARKASWQHASMAAVEREDTGDEDLDQVASFASTSSAPVQPELLPPILVPRRVRWGNESLLLATACCYTILRREGVRIDLQTVSAAAHLPFSKVRRAFKLLRLLVRDAVHDVKLANPDAYVHRILSFFRAHLQSEAAYFNTKVAKFLRPLRGSSSADTSESYSNMPFEYIEATALDLCNVWWPQRERYATDPQLGAFAIVVLAIEARLKASAPIYDIFLYTYPALQHDVALTRHDSMPPPTDTPLSKHAIALYGELCTVLKREASEIPWIADRNLTHGKQRSKRRSASSTSLTDDSRGVTDLVRRDLILHVLDILDVQRALNSRQAKQDGGSGSANATASPTPASVRACPKIDARSDPQPLDEGVINDADLEMDEGELDCFVASSAIDTEPDMVDAAIHGQDNDHSRVRSRRDDQAAAAHNHAWPAIRARLEADGVSHDLAATYQDRGSCIHLIDLLSDDQVDRLLFDEAELDSIFRKDPAEQLAFERAKVAAGDWPTVSADQRNAEFVAMAKKGVDNPHKRPCEVRKELDTCSPPSALPRQHKIKRGQRRVQQPDSLRQQQEESDWSD